MNRPEAKMTDNALMESFFHSMKAEGLHDRTFSDPQRLDQPFTCRFTKPTDVLSFELCFTQRLE